MAATRTEAFATQLTVWIGSERYTFPPGRDVTVGRDSRCDIHLGDLEESEWTSRTHVVLRFTGTQWVAIDTSRNGTYIDGVRVSRVNIRDGDAIALGDPHTGPRLFFSVSAAADAPAKASDRRHSSARPSTPGHTGAYPKLQPQQRAEEATTGPIQLTQPKQFPAQPPSPPPRPTRLPAEPITEPIPHLQSPPVQAPPFGRAHRPARTRRPKVARRKRRNLIARMTGGMRKLFQGHPAPSPDEAPTTDPLPRLDQRLVSQPAPPRTIEGELPPQPAPPRTVEGELPPQPALPAAAENEEPSQPAPPDTPDEEVASQPAAPDAPDEEPSQPALLPAAQSEEPSQPALPRAGGLQTSQLGLTIDGRELLTNVSFTARPGTLTAVIGPSAARNSGLVNLLGGATQPTSGVVTVDGHSVQKARARIGLVPRDDLVHRHLTVEQAMGYAAELRLPGDTSAEERRHVVNWVLAQLELTPHRPTRVGRLSAAERRLVSVGVELLTGPSLLVLDEPIAGLDPAQAWQMMAMLRRLADAGPVVVVATTSLPHLQTCDQVLLLTSAGTTAFAGPPAEIGRVLGTTDWSDILTRVRTDPAGTHEAFLARQQVPPPTAPPPPARLEPPPARIGLRRQISLVARRQARLIVADRRYFIFLAILPFVFGALSLVIPGNAGLGQANPYGNNPHEAVEILILLNIAAVIIGTALTIRDVVGQRTIFRREQSAALSASGYLAGKIIVFSLAAAVQTAILTAIVVVVKGAPKHGAVLLANPVVELYLAVAATAIVSAIVGLALSALADSRQQLLPMLVLVILASLVFAGGLVPLVGKLGFDQISWLVPAQWGFAASACIVDLRRADLLAPQNMLWTHYSGWWLFDLAVLMTLGAMCTGLVWWRLLPPDQRQSLGIAASPASTNRSLPGEPRELSNLRG